MLDKKIIRKSIIILLIILVILIAITLIRRVFSRYESSATSIANPQLAFWAVNDSIQIEKLSVGNISPVSNEELAEITVGSVVNSEDAHIKEVEFSFKNYDGGLTTNVPLKYDITLTATTNMPLKYELYQYGDDNALKGTPCTLEEELIVDEDGTFYRKMKAEAGKEGNDFYLSAVKDKNDTEGKEIDKFVLRVWLPDSENDGYNGENYVFADLIEDITLELNAEQLVEDDGAAS